MSRSTDDLTPDEANEQILLQAGRKAPYTQVGDWVALAVAAKLIDREALALYVILAGHVNLERGDRDVWPSRGTLATLLAYGQARSVDKYLDQLEAIDAITAHRADRGAGSSGFRRNRYTVHQTPPENHAGATTYKAWYKARLAEQKAAEATAAAARTPRSDASAPQRTTPGASASQRTTGSASQRTTVVRPSAHEQDEATRRRELGGGAAAERTARPADDAAPVTPFRAFNLDDKTTWQCRKHLAQPAPEPGVYRESCGGCGGVREWAEDQLAKRAAAAADDLARVAADCQWHDAAGDVIDPAHGGPFVPVVKCDHRTAPDVVAARLAAQAPPRADGPIAERGRAEYRRLFPPRPRQPAPRRSRPGVRTPEPVAPAVPETVSP